MRSREPRGGCCGDADQELGVGVKSPGQSLGVFPLRLGLVRAGGGPTLPGLPLSLETTTLRAFDY